MKRYGTTVQQFAGVTAKNSFPREPEPARPVPRRAFGRGRARRSDDRLTPDAANAAPIGDGAAALAVIISEKKARELGLVKPVRVAAISLHSRLGSRRRQRGSAAELCAQEAFFQAGVGPSISVIELHDASAPAEVMAYESLGLCAKGDGGKLIDTGATRLGRPVR